jgi:uncharacterized protein YjbI with pentapeptide repeats
MVRIKSHKRTALIGVLIAGILVVSGLGLLVVASLSGASSGTPSAPSSHLTTSETGAGDDWVGIDPSGTIGADSLTFSLSGFGSETDNCPNPTFSCNGRSETNAYSLQINTNTFTCNTAITGGVTATCWVQFIFDNCPNLSCINYQSLGYGDQYNIFIEYQLIGFLNTNPSCPSTSIPDGGMSWNVQGPNCWADTTHLTATGEPPSNLGNLDLTATVTSSTDSVTLTDASTSDSWTWSETDSVFGLSSSWTAAEANVFGFQGGSQADWSAGTSITVTSSLSPASGQLPFVPNCVNTGFTLESTNLFLNPCTTFADGLSFTETSTEPGSSTTATVFDASTSAPWSGSEVTGASAFAGASVTGASGITPTGTVTYNFWNTPACTGSPTTTQTVTLSGGTVPNSNPTGPLVAGSYSYMATYSGDSNNAGSQSSCLFFKVQQLQLATPPGLTGTISFNSQGDTVIALTESGNLVGEVILPPGTTYTDGTLTIYFSTSASGGITNDVIKTTGAIVPYPPGKTVDILASGNDEVCIVDAPPGVSLPSPPSCISTTPSQYQVLLMCDGVPLTVTLPDGKRTYTCTAITIGGTAYFEVTGLAHSFVETLTKGTPNITTNSSARSIVIGSSATDLATLTGGYAPNGTVNYTVYRNASASGGCTNPVFTSTEPVGTPSAPFTPTQLGLYQWVASYSGDVNNYPVASACGTEPLGVFNFAVGLSPSAETLTQGASTTMKVSVSLVPGSATIDLPIVSLTLSGLPAGVIAVGFPVSLSIGGAQSFTLETVTAASYVSCPRVANYGIQDLPGADLAHCNLAGYDLAFDDFEGTNFKGANLQGADLAGANLAGADLASANTLGTDFATANLTGANLSSAYPIGVFSLTATGTADGAARTASSLLTVLGDQLSDDSFQLAVLENANLEGDVGVQTDFAQANLVNANLRVGDFVDADFGGADLREVNLQNSRLDGANFALADIVRGDLTGAQAVGADFLSADLATATLNAGQFSRADFHLANLVKADLSNTTADRANFSGADLVNADLQGGAFFAASFVDADLEDANLARSDFDYADFQYAFTAGVIITGATFVDAIDAP